MYMVRCISYQNVTLCFGMLLEAYLPQFVIAALRRNLLTGHHIISPSVSRQLIDTVRANGYANFKRQFPWSATHSLSPCGHIFSDFKISKEQDMYRSSSAALLKATYCYFMTVYVIRIRHLNTSYLKLRQLTLPFLKECLIGFKKECIHIGSISGFYSSRINKF